MNTLQLNWKRIIWQSLIEGFQMTSLPPGWCLKTMKRQPCWCPRPVLWELNFEGFFFSNKFVQLMLAAWVKSLYSTVATEIRKCLFARYLRIKVSFLRTPFSHQHLCVHRSLPIGSLGKLWFWLNLLSSLKIADWNRAWFYRRQKLCFDSHLCLPEKLHNKSLLPYLKKPLYKTDGILFYTKKCDFPFAISALSHCSKERAMVPETPKDSPYKI